jgi:hypothetical protein
VRTLNSPLSRVESFATVAPACPSLREKSVSKLPSFVVRDFVSSWPAAAAASSAVVTARPKSRVEATGVGYAAPAAAETRREVDGIGRDVPRGMTAGTRLINLNGTNGKQQDQLHLMSRRDPRSWRPPA